MLSRTEKAENMSFVGDARETASVLRQLIQNMSPFFKHMRNVLNKGSGEGEVTSYDYKDYPFYPYTIQLPSDHSGFVYIIFSLSDNSTTYIGETNNLSKRIKQHNSGFGGSKQTNNNNLRPWALFGFVSGFEGRRADQRKFEGELQASANEFIGYFRNVKRVVELAKILMKKWSNHDLRYVHCGEL